MAFNRDDRGGGFSPRGRGGFGGGRGGGFGGRDFNRGGFGGGRGGDREMFKAICSNCGKECEVPFRPTGSKPVFCSECFEKRSRDAGHGNFQDRGPRPSNFDNRGAGQSQSGELSAISAKLDKIITLLTPSVSVGAPKAEKIEVAEVKPKKEIVKTLKKKKVAKKPTSEDSDSLV